MLPGTLYFGHLKDLDPRLGLNDRVRRVRHRPRGTRIRRQQDGTEA
jgi:hypothetical protein